MALAKGTAVPSNLASGRPNLLHVMYSSRSLLDGEDELAHSVDAMKVAESNETDSAETDKMAAETMADLGAEVRRLRAKLAYMVSEGGPAAKKLADEFDAKNPVGK